MNLGTGADDTGRALGTPRDDDAEEKEDPGVERKERARLVA